MTARRLIFAIAASAAVAVAQPAASAAQPAPDGFALNADGATLVHQASGFRFPKQVGLFTRTAETSFDPSGQYVAISYGYTPAGGVEIAIRLALIEIEAMTAAEHYAAMKPQAERYFSAINVIFEGPVASRADGATAYRGTFSGARDGAPWEFSLTTIDFGRWSGRIATAYPLSQRAEAVRALDDFIAKFPVPPTTKQ